MRRIASDYARHPNPPDVNGERWLALEAEIDAALAAGDPDGALDAIRAWERFAREALGVDLDG